MSLFSNSNPNRRIKRGGQRRSQSLLEVTARPDKEHNVHIRRRVGICLKGILTVAMVSVVVFGGRKAVQRLIWENPSYEISDIRFTTDGMLTRAQVLEVMDLHEGRNIFTVDIGKLRNSLDQLPQVERAEVRRSLPDRIDIRVVERQPVAWVSASETAELIPGGNAFLVDTRGLVMRTRKVLPEHLTLPLIVGVHMEDVAPGQMLPSAESLAAVELLRLGSDDIRWQPRVVDVSKGYCLQVTDQRRAKVTFGFDGLEEQINRLHQLLDAVEPMQRDLQTVNLMLERNVPVTFAPPPPPPAPTVDAKGKGKAPVKSASSTPAQPVSTAVTADQISKAQAQAAQAQAIAQAKASLPPPPPVVPASPVSSRPVAAGSASQTPHVVSSPSGDPAPNPAPNPSPIVQLMAKHEPASAPSVISSSAEPAKESPSKAPKPVEPKVTEIKPKKVSESEARDVQSPAKVTKKAIEPDAEPAVTKSVRKKTDLEADVSPPRAVPVEKPAAPAKPPSTPPPAQGTLIPTEGLRRLFQPHG